MSKPSVSDLGRAAANSKCALSCQTEDGPQDGSPFHVIQNTFLMLDLSNLSYRWQCQECAGTLLRGHDGIIEMIEAQRLATVPLDTGSAVDAGPTQLRVTDGRALVWASEDAMTLRTKHRITGSALGHPTGPKHTEPYPSLPLLLTLEETLLICENGWATLQGASSSSETEMSASLRRLCQVLRQPTSRALSATEATCGLILRTSLLSLCSLMRYIVFRSLHSKGLWLTSGEKFGAAFLTYCADPMVVHSQYCVHVVDASKELDAVVLAGIARGSHGARKHLLLAAVELDGVGEMSLDEAAWESRLKYITIAPASEFGS